MNAAPETVMILLSWAVKLSGYPIPDHVPVVEYMPNSFFVEEACNGVPCLVFGWYRDTGVVYQNDVLREDDGSYAASYMVHELVHFLQDLSGKFSSTSCADKRVREAEAYKAQNAYLTAYGNPTLISHRPVSCREAGT